MNQKEYYNKIASEEIKVVHETIQFVSKRLEDTVVYNSGLNKNDVILDLGCGEGKLEKRLKNNFIIGVDISIGEIRKAKLGKFVLCDANKLPFKTNAFDKILSMEVIEHLPSLNQVYETVAEMHRVLKNNGTAVVSTPNRDSLIFFFTHIFRGKRNPNSALHPTMLSMNYLKKIFCKNGFIIKKIQSYLLPLPFPRYEHITPEPILKALFYIGNISKPISTGFIIKVQKK